MGIPLCIICCFFFFNLFFVRLICVLVCIFSDLSFMGLSGLGCLSPVLEKFSTIISADIYSDPFSPSRTRPCDLNVGVFNVVPEVSETVLIYFDSFFFILLLNSSFSHSVVQLTYLFFCFSYSAISSFQCIFHFSSCVFHHCLLFSSSRSLLYISVFSRPVPPSSF